MKPDNATDKTVTWTSSDPAVATVDGGKVTAVKAGTATITAKAGDKTATCAVTVKEHILASLFGNYDFYGMLLAYDDEEDELYFDYFKWGMTISPYEGSDTRVWIDNVTLFNAYFKEYFEHGDVYAEVSEDMTTINIPVPQQVASTAWVFEMDEPYILYKMIFDYETFDFSYIKSAGNITFKLYNDGSWRTKDVYGFATPSVVKDGMLLYYYMNCFSDLDDDYPTAFVKKKVSGPTLQAAPAKSKAAKRVFTMPRNRKELVHAPLLPENFSRKLNK